MQGVTERVDPIRPAREHLGHPVGDSGQVIRPEKAVPIGVEQREHVVHLAGQYRGGGVGHESSSG